MINQENYPSLDELQKIKTQKKTDHLCKIIFLCIAWSCVFLIFLYCLFIIIISSEIFINNDYLSNNSN